MVMRSLLEEIGKSNNLAKPALLVMTGYSSEVMVGERCSYTPSVLRAETATSTSPFLPSPRTGRKRMAGRVR